MRPAIAVFVDVQNVYYTTRQIYRRQFDYSELWRRLTSQGEVVVANAYATERGDAGQHRFQAALKHIGFTVKLKPFIQRSDGSAKGDWDVGIAIDVMEVIGTVDVVVLVSGDGDFDLLMKKVRASAMRAEVYGVEKLTANSLILSASTFHPITETLLL